MAGLKVNATATMYAYDSWMAWAWGKFSGFADKSVIWNSVTTMTMFDNRIIFTMNSERQFHQTNVCKYVCI